MVVDNLDLLCAIIPNEADPILVIDADAMLAFAVTLERFQMIAWWASQVLQRDRSIQHVEFPAGDLGIRAERFHILAVEESLRSFALEAHSVSRYPSSGMRGADISPNKKPPAFASGVFEFQCA
jgi:hypothetical protein